jgi:hypothetical protein
MTGGNIVGYNLALTVKRANNTMQSVFLVLSERILKKVENTVQ